MKRNAMNLARLCTKICRSAEKRHSGASRNPVARRQQPGDPSWAPAFAGVTQEIPWILPQTQPGFACGHAVPSAVFACHRWKARYNNSLRTFWPRLNFLVAASEDVQSPATSLGQKTLTQSLRGVPIPSGRRSNLLDRHCFAPLAMTEGAH